MIATLKSKQTTKTAARETPATHKLGERTNKANSKQANCKLSARMRQRHSSTGPGTGTCPGKANKQTKRNETSIQMPKSGTRPVVAGAHASCMQPAVAVEWQLPVGVVVAVAVAVKLRYRVELCCICICACFIATWHLQSLLLRLSISLFM